MLKDACQALGLGQHCSPSGARTGSGHSLASAVGAACWDRCSSRALVREHAAAVLEEHCCHEWPDV